MREIVGFRDAPQMRAERSAWTRLDGAPLAEREIAGFARCGRVVLCSHRGVGAVASDVKGEDAQAQLPPPRLHGIGFVGERVLEEFPLTWPSTQTAGGEMLERRFHWGTRVERASAKNHPRGGGFRNPWTA